MHERRGHFCCAMAGTFGQASPGCSSEQCPVEGLTQEVELDESLDDSTTGGGEALGAHDGQDTVRLW